MTAGSDPNPVFECRDCGRKTTYAELQQAGIIACPSCGSTSFKADTAAMDLDTLHRIGEELGMASSHTGALSLAWVHIAVDAAIRSREASDTLDTDKEFGESLLATTAAAHAVDGFYGGFRHHVTAPTFRERTRRPSKVIETAKVAFDISTHVAAMGDALEWLYDLRDDAVHFNEKPQPLTRHHNGSIVTYEIAHWSWPQAERATDVMLGFMLTCCANPKVKWKLGLRSFSEWMAGPLGLFQARWAEGRRSP